MIQMALELGDELFEGSVVEWLPYGAGMDETTVDIWRKRYWRGYEWEDTTMPPARIVGTVATLLPGGRPLTIVDTKGRTWDVTTRPGTIRRIP